MSRTTFETPYEYRAGILPGNSLAPGGFADSYVLKRFSPNNGTSFSAGNRITVNISDAECNWHPSQTYIRFKPTAKGADDKPYTKVDVHGAVSGQSSYFKTLTTSGQGKLIEPILNYNRFVAQEIANSSLERKIFLNRTEGTSFFVNGKNSQDSRQDFLGDNNGKRYAMHQIQWCFNSLPILELPLVGSRGIDLEIMLTNDIKEPYPDTTDAKVTNFTLENIEVICVMSRPAGGFWADWTQRLERGEVIPRMLQIVRSQSFQGNNSTSTTLTIDSGLARSISSVMVLGNKQLKADVVGDKPETIVPAVPKDDANFVAASPAGAYVDKLSYSVPLGVRNISFRSGGKQVPDFQGISYSPLDPMAYIMGFRHTSPEQLTQVPSMQLYDNPQSLGGAVCQSWQFRFNFKQSISAFGDGLSTPGGNFQVVLTSIPPAPEMLLPSATPPTFGESDNFEVYYSTDNVCEIGADGLRINPVW